MSWTFVFQIVAMVFFGTLAFFGGKHIVEYIVNEYKTNPYTKFGYIVAKFLPREYGQRLTESLYHCNRGWFISFLNVVGIITTFRFGSGDCGGRGHSIYAWCFGHLNPNNENRIKKLMDKHSEEFTNQAKKLFGENWERYDGISEMFIPGHNLFDVCFWGE